MEWTYYDSLSPQNPIPQMERPTVQSKTDKTNPELDIYNSLIRAKNTSPQGESQGESPVEEKMEVPKKKAEDISDPTNTWDLVYIFLAVLFIDVLVLFLTRYYPDIFGRNLNRWYDLFGLNAVIADVLVIVLGFVIARYVYKKVIAPKFLDGEWSPLAFTGTLVGVQFIHDILFYFGVILPIPRGHNMMIDVFKDYSAAGGKILMGDALMMIGSSAVAILLKGMRPDYTAAFGLLTAYALPYILYTRNEFSILR